MLLWQVFCVLQSASLPQNRCGSNYYAKKLEGMKALREASQNDEAQLSSETTSAKLEDLKKTLAEVRLCCKLDALLLKKKCTSHGDSPEVRSQKVDKMRIMAESLISSTGQAEKRISDHRSQKDEALKFRVVKANEVIETEKELVTEFTVLEKQRGELESELKREEDLSRFLDSCKVEADVVHTWINFMQNTWLLQSTYTEQKEKQTNDALVKHGKYFTNLVFGHLSKYKEELGTFVIQIRKTVEHLKKINEREEIESNLDGDISSKWRILKEEYLEWETKVPAASVDRWMRLQEVSLSISRKPVLETQLTNVAAKRHMDGTTVRLGCGRLLM